MLEMICEIQDGNERIETVRPQGLRGMQIGSVVTGRALDQSIIKHVGRDAVNRLLTKHVTRLSESGETKEDAQG